MKKVVLLSTIMLLSACASTQDQQKDNADMNSEAKKQQVETSNVDTENIQKYSVKDFNQFAKNNILYFDFDSSKIVGKKLIRSYVENINKIDGLNKIVISGYCDERGSNEYNDKLGQKRSDAVKNVLIENGLNDNIDVVTISNGKRKFKKYSNDFEQNQQANRKAEVFAYQK